MLRKRTLGVLALVLVVALIATAAVGCTFVRENDVRKVNESYATVTNGGITLDISYNEFIDYFNSMGYLYVQYYGYSVEDALDLTISNKIQQKYLLTLAMPYLAAAGNAERYAALFGKGATVKPEDVLTYAERYAAIYAVNDSVMTSVEDLAAELKRDDLSGKIGKAEKRGVKELRFTQSTLDYFDTFFHLSSIPSGCYVGQEMDFDKVQIEIVYDDGSVSEPYVVPDSMYTTAFTSEATESYSERTEDKEFVITFEEEVTGKDGEVTTENVTLTYEYTLVYPREALEEAEEETDYSEVVIGDFDAVSRYTADADIPSAVKEASVKYSGLDEMRLAKANGNTFEEEAWRQIGENLDSAGKTLDYLYRSQFESQVLTALQSELYLSADKAFESKTDVDSNIIEEYKYLYETAKEGYTGDADADKEAFIEAVGDGIDAMYYYPSLENAYEYYYVYQILFSFTDEQAAFLEELDGDEDAIKDFTEIFYGELKTQASNPDFDIEDENSAPFGDEEKVSAVVERLQSELAAVYAGNMPADAEGNPIAGYGFTAEDLTTLEGKQAAAIEIFVDYMYKYNDDPGIFNNDYGYLMTADPADSGWVDAFNDLGDAIFTYDNEDLGGKVGNAFESDESDESDGGKLAWRASDYGIHLMMISSTPFSGASDGDGNGIYDELAMPADSEIIAYLKDRTNPVSGESMYDTLRDGLKDENRTAVYNDFVKKVPTDIFERNDKNKLVLNEDVESWLEIKANKIKKEIYEVYVG